MSTEGQAEVTVIATAGSGRARVLDVAWKAGVVPRWTRDQLDEVAAFEAEPGIDVEDLTDLRKLAFVTIDEVESRDLDQALYLQRLETGYRVWYAIADAAWFAPRDSALFRHAVDVGGTYYMPGWVVPMLPKQLSEGLTSINPAVDRRALVFRVDLDDEGEVVSDMMMRARVHSVAKLDYDGVQAWFDGEAELATDNVAARESLGLLLEIGGLRERLATSRGVVRYRRRQVRVDVEGLGFVVRDEGRNAVERANEQISLLCNVVGARRLAHSERDWPGIHPVFRVHDAPPPAAMESFRAQLAGLARGLGRDALAWAEQESLAAYLERIPDSDAGRAIHRQAVMTNVAGQFSEEAKGHHGVGAEVYGRFTAPMREAVGVYLHQELWDLLRGVPSVPLDEQADQALRDAVVATANRHRQRQSQLDRDINRLVIDDLAAALHASGATVDAVVMGMTKTKVHVQLDQPLIDLKLYVADLEPTWPGLSLTWDGAAMRDASGAVRLHLGQRLHLRVRGLHDKRDRWVFGLEHPSTELGNRSTVGCDGNVNPEHAS